MDDGSFKVTVTRRRTITANEVSIRLTVTSDQFLMGGAAQLAASHLAPVIAAIKQHDPVVRISVVSVQSKSNAGLFGAGSKAEYRLRVTTKKLDALGAIIGACADGKGITVGSLDWSYDEEPVKVALVTEAAAAARKKAEALAAVLGYTIVGIKACSDGFDLPDFGGMADRQPGHYDPGMMDFSKGRASHRGGGAVDLGSEFTSEMEVAATFSCVYRLRPPDTLTAATGMATPG